MNNNTNSNTRAVVLAGAPNGGDAVPPGTFHGGDAVPPGTFHGGDAVPPGTFHAVQAAWKDAKTSPPRKGRGFRDQPNPSFIEVILTIITEITFHVIFGTSLTPTSTRTPRPMSSYRTYYRTRDDRANYEFSFEQQRDGTWRAYILGQPGYGYRDDDAHSTHRLTDGGRKYVCWTEPLRMPRAGEASGRPLGGRHAEIYPRRQQLLTPPMKSSKEHPRSSA